jgi:hypothetical protein
LIILIAFFTWKFFEGATFPEIHTREPLAALFSTLWYTNNMMKQWQSNAMFHGYYKQLKDAIKSFLCMTPCTLHQYQPITKFPANPHFTYITPRRDEHHEELQSYYKLTYEGMEKIMARRISCTYHRCKAIQHWHHRKPNIYPSRKCWTVQWDDEEEKAGWSPGHRKWWRGQHFCR